MFGRSLSEFEGLSRKAPRVLIYKGTDKLEKAGKDFPGKKGYVLGFEGLIDFINKHMPSNNVIATAYRNEVRAFPEDAVRELVANALIHQDFNETGTSVTIEIYSNRLEVSNPGTPIIPPDRFADGFQSRNETLAGLARRLGMCEEQGLGIDRVLKSAEVNQLPAPSFRQGARHLSVVIFAQKRFDEMDRQERINACFWHCALRFAKRGTMNNESLRERFDLSESRSPAVSGVIADTKNAGKIKLDNPANSSNRYAKWVPYWA
jgi:ATP-dependent DNA helicase RecG